MQINRKIASLLQKTIKGEPKVIILYGPRQAGKTTMINQILAGLPEPAAFFDGDDLRVQEIFGTPNLQRLSAAVGSARLIFIDEAQRIADIGQSLKLLYDNLKIRIIATGSSSFELSGKIKEPLTGRAVNYLLYPVAVGELSPASPDISLAPQLEEWLRFGMYPKVLTTVGDENKQKYLEDLMNNYLYKDILAFDNVRKPKKVIDLLAMLALQIGSEVAISELTKHLALSRQVVEKYLDILEKMFVIINLRGFSRNLRKEIYKTSKYYFVDLGMRNALIRNFNPPHVRADAGALLENFFLLEKMKLLNNRGHFANFYFWRTYDQKEIDLIEERGGQLRAYEIKWDKKQATEPKDFKSAYPQAEFVTVNRHNFLDYLQ